MHRLQDIWCEILATLIKDGLRSFKVKGLVQFECPLI